MSATALPPRESKAAAVEAMFDRIAPRYDRMNTLLTLGLDHAWRRRTVASLRLPRGAVVADLACGTGPMCAVLLRHGYDVTGYDSSQGMLDAARVTVPLVRADILHLPLADASIDGVTCGFALRNVIDLRACFAEMARVVRPGGRIALLEVAEPRSRVVRALHGLYFRRAVPFIGGLLSDAPAYRYLPESTSYLPEPEVMLQWLRDAGFPRPHRHLLGLGAAQLVTATRR
ncbi:MAG: ubiquinone/menaquinone biosynthesis methyltransferase [Candidatus Dormibacteria bacterium]